MTDGTVVDVRTVDGVQLIAVRGEVDLANAARVRDRIDRIASASASVVVVDLTETEYLDSSGIAMLFRLAARLHHRRQELRLVVPPDAPVRVALELTNLPRAIPVQDRVD